MRCALFSRLPAGVGRVMPSGALMFALSVAGCAGSADAPDSSPAPAPTSPMPDARPSGSASVTGEPFTLALHSSAQLDDLSVTFDGVTEDSRCPEDVDCVWAGRATIRLALRAGSETGEALPSIGGMGTPGDSAEALGYRFTLQELAPYPNTSRPAADEAPLEATLVVDPVAP